MLHASRYDTVLRVTHYVAIRAPVLTILLSLPNYHMTTYWITLGYTTEKDSMIQNHQAFDVIQFNANVPLSISNEVRL